MSTQHRQVSRVIFNVFKKRHGLHIQVDASRYLEEILEEELDLTEALEKIVKAYKKRYNDNTSPIVDKASLAQVVESLQTSAAAAAALTPFIRVEEDIDNSLESLTINEFDKDIDISQHFHVVNAFDMPRLHYDYHQKMFVKSTVPSSLLASAKEKGDMFCERINIVRQRLLRNESFCASSAHLSDNDVYLKITPIKSLIGHDRGYFILFGMLTQLEEGKLFLEDEDANIELDISGCVYSEGLFTDNSFVVVDGVYGDDHIFHVEEIGFPPPERREITNSTFPHLDFTGLPQPLIEQNILRLEETSHIDVSFVIISDVWLDQPKVMNALEVIFRGYANAQVPLAFILMGNFTKRPFNYTNNESTQYKDNFSALGDMISSFPSLATHSYFVFVPGAQDPWGRNTLPQPPIPDIFTSRLRQKVRRVIFTSNPCRIRYCTQDIVIFREDILAKLWRNVLLNPQLEIAQEPEKHLIRTIIDQGHLSPLSMSIRPIYWAYDHALRLYPLPQTLILADQCANYGASYGGTHCINPGSFPDSDFTWSIYYPGRRVSEKCVLN
ncbi:DNA polymerase alpha/epsilon subunit B-domain-containing protein [Spinellus fusiger]|nr:DNA polymerase alpha/epsilon subunit B-domain-containing protein [Spinellus fusiger]